MRLYLPSVLRRLKKAARRTSKAPRKSNPVQISTELGLGIILFAVVYPMILVGSPAEIRAGFGTWVLTLFIIGLGQVIRDLLETGMNRYPLYMFPVSMGRILQFYARKVAGRAIHIIWFILFLGFLVAPGHRPHWLSLAVVMLTAPVLALALALILARWRTVLYLLWLAVIGLGASSFSKGSPGAYLFAHYSPGSLLLKPLSESDATAWLLLLLGVSIVAVLIAWPVYKTLKQAFLSYEVPEAGGNEEPVPDLVSHRVTAENSFRAGEAEIRELTETRDFLKREPIPEFDSWNRGCLSTEEKRLVSEFIRNDFFTRRKRVTLQLVVLAFLLGVAVFLLKPVFFGALLGVVGVLYVLRSAFLATTFFQPAELGGKSVPTLALYPIPPGRAMRIALKLRWRAAAIDAIGFAPLLFVGMLLLEIGFGRAWMGTTMFVAANLAFGIGLDASAPWTHVRGSWTLRGFFLVLTVGGLTMLYLVELIVVFSTIFAIVIPQRLQHEAPDILPPVFLALAAVTLLPPLLHFFLTRYFIDRMWWDQIYPKRQA